VNAFVLSKDLRPLIDFVLSFGDITGQWKEVGSVQHADELKLCLKADLLSGVNVVV
jgi:hypothetical protein